MNDVDHESADQSRVPICQVPKNTMIEFDDGALGYVIVQQRSKGQTCIHLAGCGTVVIPENTFARIVVESDEFAYAYVERPAMRPMVQQSLSQARGAATQVISDLLFQRRS